MFWYCGPFRKPKTLNPKPFGGSLAFRAWRSQVVSGASLLTNNTAMLYGGSFWWFRVQGLGFEV